MMKIAEKRTDRKSREELLIASKNDEGGAVGGGDGEAIRNRPIFPLLPSSLVYIHFGQFFSNFFKILL